MNDNNKGLDAKCSLCWKCKFGICIQEQEQEDAYLVGDGQPRQRSEFEAFETPYEEENEESSELIQTVEHKRVKAICYWKPEQVEVSPPILVANVKQCSRFEQK